MIPELEEDWYVPGKTGYRYVCPRCDKRGNFEASTGAAIYLLSLHMEGH